MNNNTSISTEYIPIPHKVFPHKTYKHSELRQLKKYKLDKTINTSLPAIDIHFCSTLPNLLSIFTQDQVYVYDNLSDSLITKFPQIKDTITCGTFRSDGKVILTGTESGRIIIHDIINKNVLRKYTSHTLNVSCINVNRTNVQFVSVAKDFTLKQYEMSVKTPIREYTKAHSDYISVCRYINDTTVLTGAYDKTVKLWDTKANSNNAVVAFDNGNTCQDICVLNGSSGNYFISTSDNSVMLFDIRKPNAYVNTAVPVQSTLNKVITSLNEKRLFVVPGNESFVKVLDIEDLSLRSLFSFHLKQTFNAFSVANDMKHYCVCYTSGDIEIRSKNIQPTNDSTNSENDISHRLDYDKEEHDIQLLDPSKYADKPIVKNYKYFNRGQYIKNVDVGDVHVAKSRKKNLQKHDKLIKAFQFQKAVDSVIKDGNVEMILAVFEELIDRNALKLALMNRNEEEVEVILGFVLWKIRDVKTMGIAVYVFEIMVKYYMCVAKRNKKVKEMFDEVYKVVNEEIKYQEELMGVKEEIDMVEKVYNTIN